MNLEPCKKVCNECGFLRGSQIGVLTNEVRNVIQRGILFPCHLELKAVTGSENQGIETYNDGSRTVKICRGYILSMKKSGIPPLNPYWEKLYRDVGEIDDPRIMDISEALKYHGR